MGITPHGMGITLHGAKCRLCNKIHSIHIRKISSTIYFTQSSEIYYCTIKSKWWCKIDLNGNILYFEDFEIFCKELKELSEWFPIHLYKFREHNKEKKTKFWNKWFLIKFSSKKWEKEK